MVILTEDREFAEFSLREGCIAVPIAITRNFAETETEILVYESFLPLANQFVERFADAPFSDAAISFLKESLSLPMHVHGFFIPKDYDKRIRVFRLMRLDEVNSDRILPETLILSGKDTLSAYKNATTHELEMDPDDPDDISAVVLHNGVIVAYATVNDLYEAENDVEISVECAREFRGRGYATSCAVSLSAELLKRGYTVSYKCRHTNEPSVKVAEKAGFAEVGMEYNFVCYRNTASGE